MANNDTFQTQSPDQASQPTQIPDANIYRRPTATGEPVTADTPQQATTVPSVTTDQNLSSSPPPAGTPPTQGTSSPKSRWIQNPLVKIILGVGIVLIIVLLVIFFLPKGQAEKVNLTWWGLWEDSAVVAPIIQSYEAEHPNVTITYSKQDPKQYRERLLTRSELGTGPDIFLFHNTWYPMLSEILLPLPTDVITHDAFTKTYYPVMQEDLIRNGAIYGIPFSADTVSLFVNTELLTAAGEQVPTTWEDFVTVAKRLTVKEEIGTIRTSGVALGTFGNINHAPDIISLLFLQQGIAMDEFGSSPQNEIDALDFYTSFAKGSQNTWDSSLDQSLILFSQGKLAFYFGYSWDIFTIQRLNKELAFGVHPVPGLFERNMTVASYWVTGVSNKSAYQQEALAFLAYLSQKETVQRLYTEAAKTRAFGPLYARMDLASTLKDNALVYPFVSQLQNAKSSFFASDTGDGAGGINSVSNTYLGNAVNGIITDGSSTVTAVETLNQGIAQVFAQYGIQ